MAIICVHVDDFLIAHNDQPTCERIIRAMASKWDVSDLMSPTRLLGMHITQDRKNGRVHLSQREYVKSLITKFRMSDSNPIASPHAPGLYLSSKSSPTTEQGKLEMSRVPYAELVGSLNWLACNTRPDISTIVGTLCRFISNPGREHWKAAQRVLKYLAHTLDHGLIFTKDATTHRDIVGYSDADWAGDPDTRRSTTGYVFLLCGGPISWKSKLQASTALSSVEAEYIAICSASREAKWLRQLLDEIGFPAHGATKIYEDNRGCEAIASNRRTDARTKHIDVKYHFVRQMVEQNIIQIVRAATDVMIADTLTKPTSVRKFEWCRDQMGIKRMIEDIDLRGSVEVQTDNEKTIS